MKNKLRLVLACLAAIACSASLGVTRKSPTPAASPRVTPSPKAKSSPSPKTTPSPSPSPSTHPAPMRPLPFHGRISAVDQKAKTFSVGKEKARVFKVTNKTVLSKGGAAATMKDVVVNDEVRGSYWKLGDGSLEAKTVKLGPKTDAEKAATEKKPESSPTPTPITSPER